MTELSEKPLYEQLGGEPTVRALVDRFYDVMDQMPEVAVLRALHPADLASSRDKLHWFLCGWLGGPALYVERFGHPRLRARHLPFPIGERERDQWLSCMARALGDIVLDDKVRDAIWRRIVPLADHMRNRDLTGG